MLKKVVFSRPNQISTWRMSNANMTFLWFFSITTEGASTEQMIHAGHGLNQSDHSMGSTAAEVGSVSRYLDQVSEPSSYWHPCEKVCVCVSVYEPWEETQMSGEPARVLKVLNQTVCFCNLSIMGSDWPGSSVCLRSEWFHTKRWFPPLLRPFFKHTHKPSLKESTSFQAYSLTSPWLGPQLNQKWFVFIGLLRWQVGYHPGASTCQRASENPPLTMPNASN